MRCTSSSGSTGAGASRPDRVSSDSRTQHVSTTPTTSQASPEIVEVINAYIAALNKRDLDGVRAAFHFPHVLFGTGMVTHYPTPDDLSFTAFDARTAQHGW